MADNENLNTEAVEPVEVVHDLPVERSLLGATLGATASEDDQEPDEEYSTIPVRELLEVKLGRQGENDTQTVVIDCSAWLQQLPGCTFMIAATRPGEREIYLPEVTVSNGVVTWPILEQDTACAGTGRAEVRAMLNDKIKKSALFRTRIEPALEPGGSPDAPTPPNWVRLIIESVEASQQAAEHAEELVDEATACAINAVRFDENQGLTDEQKAIGRGNIGAASVAALEAQATATAQALAGKVAIDQGVAQAGKAMIVGPDGNVTTGDAVQIDATLQQAGQAADAAAVGTALAGKVAVQQGSGNAGKALVVGADGNVTTGDAGIPDAVKVSLLNLVRHVAYTDDQGQAYYDALYVALYGGSGGWPRLEATYTPGSHVVYTDDALDTLRPYLTVKRRENAQDSGTVVTDYTLSGTLVDGMSTVLVRKDALVTAVQVEAVDFYNIWEWSLAEGNVVKLVATVDPDVNAATGCYIGYTEQRPTQAPKRRSTVTKRGILPYTIYGTTDLAEDYPIPIPKTANKIKVTVAPNTQYSYINILKYDAVSNRYTTYSDSVKGWTEGTNEKSFTASENLFAVVNYKYDSAGTSYPTEPTAITIEFSEV